MDISENSNSQTASVSVPAVQNQIVGDLLDLDLTISSTP